MRADLLKAAELKFLEMYPGGFSHPEMEAIKKKHRGEKMQAMAREMFAESRFSRPDDIVADMAKIISRSSLVSVFEKPKFRDFVLGLSEEEKMVLSHGLHEQLHGDREHGFNTVLEILAMGKLAKWSLISVIPYYYYPQKEAFMKPTTVKGIINTFQLEGLTYKARPSYDFYVNYRKQLLEMRKLVDPGLGPDNAAFSGFLMLVMQ